MAPDFCDGRSMMLNLSASSCERDHVHPSQSPRNPGIRRPLCPPLPCDQAFDICKAKIGDYVLRRVVCNGERIHQYSSGYASFDATH